MDDETKDDEILEQQESESQQEGHSDYKPVNRFDAAAVHHLSGSSIAPCPIWRTA